MRSLVLALALVACDAAPGDPDAAPADAAQPYDRCEQLDDARVPCRDDACAGAGVRVCGTEPSCQMWDDCACYQCRVRFWCECRP